MKFTHGLFLFAASCASVSLVRGDSLDIRPIATVALAGAEISDFDPASDRLFVTASSGLQIIDLSNPAAPAVVTTLNFTAAPYNLPVTDVTSVAVHNGVVAVALPAADKANPGTVVFLNAADGALLGTATVGSLPDNIAFTPDGSKVLTANEGELTTAFNGTANSALPTVTNDATLGTVSIIDVSGGFASAPVSTADFTAYDTAPQVAALKAAGVRIFDGGKPSTDFEPEYVAISPAGTEALVVLQEANAVAILNIATATFTSVLPLGEKNFSTLLADFSDQDGPGGSAKTLLTRGNPVFGLYMPDEATSYQVAGNTYYLIANEGDDRDDFLNPNETARVSSLTLDPTTFPDAVTLKTNTRLGRLTVSNSNGLRGDTGGDGDVDRILAYGGRSFSILNSAGTMVYDSGDLIERAIACFGTPWFDDTRSDNKAAEPEGIEIGVIGARTYAFVGLERARGVMAFDITDPANVTSAGFGTVSTDQNPEGIEFISAANSPTGAPLLAVTNEMSNTLSIYSVAPVDYTLQLLHLADAEAGLLASSTAPNLAALVDGFDGQFANTLILAGGDNFIPGPFLAAGTDLSVRDELNSTTGSTISLDPAVNHPIAAVDIAIHNLLGVEVSAIGNHEFDLGSRVFRDAFIPGAGWVGAQFPHISANLDFSGDSDLASRFDNTLDGGVGTLIPEASTKKGRIVPSAVVTKGGEKIGVLGATTQIIESISSPSGTEVKGFPGGSGPNGEVDDMDLLASQLQPVINELIAEGVDKIVLMAHLQQIANEQLLATKLSGVDVILSAGSNTRLGDADDTAVAFAGHNADFANTYPIRTTGLNGKPVVIINTDNEFTYLGRLVVDFDANGDIIVPNLATRSAINGAYASTDANVAAAWGVNIGDLPTTAFAPGTKGTKVKTLTDAVNGVISTKDGTVYGITTVYLEGERSFVRSEETNLGNLTADANADALRSVVGGSAPVVSLKNGGGIRAQIGAVSSAGGSAVKLPPPANPSVGKPEGGISLLDLENSLRFNNRLMAFDTTPAGLKAILEHSVFLGVNQGRFGQVGGLTFSWDPTLPAGSRVRTVSLTDENGDVAAAIVKDGLVRPDAPATIRAVTLSFLAQGGDGYPIKANGSNFRFIRDNGTLDEEPRDESLDFGSAAITPANALGEIEAAAEYITAEYPNLANAFTSADTPVASDLRIQRLSARTDTVLAYTAAEIDTLNTFYSFLVGQGLSPHQSIGNPTLAAAAGTIRSAGRADVTSNPSAFSLYTASSIQDLRGTGNLLVQAQGANVTLTLPLQKSTTLGGWEPAGNLGLTFPKIENKEFYRVTLPQ